MMSIGSFQNSDPKTDSTVVSAPGHRRYNILVSGLNFLRGKPFELLELARTGKISLTVSEVILDEMEDVLRRKFGWNDERIAIGRKRVTDMARTVASYHASERY